MRFETIAQIHKWKESEYFPALSSLLQGEALNTLYGLREENRNYRDLKSALLKRYKCTEDSFRMKFKAALPLQTEDFASFINRISRLFDLWLESAQVKTGDFKQLHELILRDQIYESCHLEMVSFLKERDPKSIDDIRKAAELFISSRPNAKLAKEPKVSSLVAVRQDKKGQEFVTGQHFSTQFQNRPTESSRPRSQSVPRISNNDNFNSQGPSQGSYGEAPRWSRRGTFYGQSSYPSFRGRGASSRGRFTSNQFSRGGRGYHRGAAGFKQMRNSYHAASSSFMKSPNQQAKALRLFSGTVNGKHCSVLRVTGCNCVGVSKRLLLPDDYLGKKEKCKLFMGEAELDTVAVHISTPFYKGKIVPKSTGESSSTV